MQPDGKMCRQIHRPHFIHEILNVFSRTWIIVGKFFWVYQKLYYVDIT